MKRLILLFLTFIVLMIIMINMFDFGKIIFKNSRYEVLNEKKEVIKARVFDKKDKVIKTGKELNGITIVFDKINSINTFVYYPDEQLFGISDGGNGALCYVDIFKNISFQKSKRCDYYKIIYYKENFNDYFKDEFGNRLIKNLKFTENNGVEFDAFGELKKYGSRIIIQKK